MQMTCQLKQGNTITKYTGAAFQYPYHLTIQYGRKENPTSLHVGCKMQRAKPKMPGCPIASSRILQNANEHALLANLTHIAAEDTSHRLSRRESTDR